MNKACRSVIRPEKQKLFLTIKPIDKQLEKKMKRIENHEKFINETSYKN